MINKIKGIFLSADAKLLFLCPSDYSKQKRRATVALVIAIAAAISSGSLFRNNIYLGALTGVVTYLLYLLFIIKFGGNGFFKIVLALGVAFFLFYSTSVPFFGGIEHLTIRNVDKIAIATLSAIVCIVLSVIPINLCGEDNAYIKRYQQKCNRKRELTELELEKKYSYEKDIINNRYKARIQRENEIEQYLNNAIKSKQTAMIDRIIASWSQEMLEGVRRNSNDYFTSGVALEILESEKSRNDVNAYCSELISEKQKEIAEIIIDRWAKEQTAKVHKNPNSIIPQ